MDLEYFRRYCLSKKEVTEGLPFGEDTLVFKVKNKMFALTSLVEFVSVNLKCDPEEAVRYREQYPDIVLPGYHMNKKHWNTVMVNQQVGDNLLLEMTDASYQLVVNSLPKKDRESFNLST